MLETIDDVEGGSHSLPELTFVRIVRGARLPMPQRQVVVRRRDGRWYLDVEWTEWHVAGEIDGAAHLEVRQAARDISRANEIVINGRMLLRFSSYQVRHEPAYVAATLERALRSRGWRGP